MPGKKIKLVDGVGCVSITRALDEFTKHCKRKNLSPVTVKYYTEDINYFNHGLNQDKIYRKNGERYIVSPWEMIYVDDKYYLLAWDT